MPSKKHTRRRILLDEGLHLPNSYPNLNRLHSVLHVSQTKLRGEKDEDIFKFAIQEQRTLIVFNIKDFKNLIESDKPSVISLSVNLTDKQADLKACKVLKNLKSNEIKGHLISISLSGVIIRRITRSMSTA